MIYTLCGSSRFPEAFHLVNAHLSMRGHIVISLGLFGHADEPRGARFLTSDGDESTDEKVALDQLHFRKIDLADAIFVINVGGYVGPSTKREIEYAELHGKDVFWLFPEQPAPSREAAMNRLTDAARIAALEAELAEAKAERGHAFQDGWDAHEAHIAMHSEPFKFAFPTMLRKMWSGGEVQAWLDALPPLYAVKQAVTIASPVPQDRTDEAQAEVEREERRRLENEAMDDHFRRHPHG